MERWVSGLNRRFAKPLQLERVAVGSNPARSAGVELNVGLSGLFAEQNRRKAAGVQFPTTPPI